LGLCYRALASFGGSVNGEADSRGEDVSSFEFRVPGRGRPGYNFVGKAPSRTGTPKPPLEDELSHQGTIWAEVPVEALVMRDLRGVLHSGMRPRSA